MTTNNTPQPPTFSSFVDMPQNNNRLTVYFFQPKSWFGWLIKVLQFLTGAPWSAPTHVAIGYKGTLYQLFADGFSMSDQTEAAYRMADDVYTLELTEDESLDMLALCIACANLHMRFSLSHSVWFVWQMITRRGTKVYCEGLDFGDVGVVKGGDMVFFCPPLTCTTLVWFAIEHRFETIDWRIITPHSLQTALDNLPL